MPCYVFLSSGVVSLACSLCAARGVLHAAVETYWGKPTTKIPDSELRKIWISQGPAFEVFTPGVCERSKPGKVLGLVAMAQKQPNQFKPSCALGGKSDQRAKN
eukprot:1162694-Pleurochrysis_carterae.AAC.9